jgi:hypothetical protein
LLVPRPRQTMLDELPRHARDGCRVFGAGQP